MALIKNSNRTKIGNAGSDSSLQPHPAEITSVTAVVCGV